MINKYFTIKNDNINVAERIANYGGDNGCDSYALTRRYLVKNGRPWFPILGEFHFSRYPSQYWDESLQKMKAGGIDIVSTYVFWIHHEEEKGIFNWQGNKNLRRFIEICRDNGLLVCLRIGPWSHGECRNGGFPDWLVKSGIKLRENNGEYLSYVKKFYSEIYNQVKGLLFYDKGPIIFIQIENEYGHCGGIPGEEGKKHIMALKKLAVDIGFKVPFYTTTGWGNSVVVEGETLPVLGAYAEAPWEQHIKERRAASEYLFSPIRHETNVGTDLSSNMLGSFSYDIKRFPYLMAELGSGHEPTHHRRPIISGDDTGALALAFLGSGANLLGYYMYHGGTNPIGKYSTLQESKATGYLNDVPELSYDFQAPIGEYGRIRGAYGRLKAINLFLHDFGEEMAQTVCFLPNDNPIDAEEKEHLRYCVRYGKDGGFLFLSNYQRRRTLTHKSDVNVKIITENGAFSFENIDLPDKKYVLYPFDLGLGGAKLVAATAQLLCSIDSVGAKTFFFFCYDGDKPEFQFKCDGIKSIDSPNKHVDIAAGIVSISPKRADFHRGFTVIPQSGKAVRIVMLKRSEAYHAYKLRQKSGECLVITDACLYGRDGVFNFASCKREIGLLSFPALGAMKINGASLKRIDKGSNFCRYKLVFDKAEKAPEVKINALSRKNGKASYKISATRSKGGSTGDDILILSFEGDRARLYIDGSFSADKFYDGTDWEIGLRRFGKTDGRDMRLDIEQLKSDDFVFLEKKPQFTGGIACRLCGAAIIPEYHCTAAFLDFPRKP